MPWLEAVALSIGELAGYLVGLMLCRTFDLPPKRAQAIGEYLILGVIATVAIVITIIYS
jgi:hypothetical protein